LHAQTEASTATIGASLAENGSTSILLDALEAADLVSALKEEGSTVLLAPTNEAFELLLHHLVSDSGGAFATATAEKLQGTDASASGNIACSNGAVYLIDRVLLPPGFNLKALME